MYWDSFLILLFLLAMLDSHLKNNLGILSAVFFFIALSGNFLNGVDWIHYFTIYDNLKYNIIISNGIEPGFYFLMKLTNEIGFDYQQFVIMCNLIIISIFYCAISFFTKRISFAIFIFYLAFCLGLFNEQLRQAIAFVIIVYSYRYIIYGKRNYFCIGVVIASLFHISAIFSLIVLYSYKINFNKRNATFLIIFSVFLNILMPYLYNLIMPFFPATSFIMKKLTLYNEMGNVGGGKFGVFVIFDVVWIYLLIIIFSIREMSTKEKFLVNISILGCLFHMIFYALPSMQRLTYYLFFGQIILFIEIFRLKMNVSKMLYSLMILTFLFYNYYSKQFSGFSKGYFNNNIYFFSIGENIDYYDYQYKRCQEISIISPTFCIISNI